MEQKKNRNTNTNGKNTNMFKRKTFVQNREFWMLFLGNQYSAQSIWKTINNINLKLSSPHWVNLKIKSDTNYYETYVVIISPGWKKTYL